MKWQKGRDRDGNVIERAAVSDTGHKIARFTGPGGDQFRASYQGEFIHFPVKTKEEAVKACNAHFAAANQ